MARVSPGTERRQETQKDPELEEELWWNERSRKVTPSKLHVSWIWKERVSHSKRGERAVQPFKGRRKREQSRQPSRASAESQSQISGRGIPGTQQRPWSWRAVHPRESSIAKDVRGIAEAGQHVAEYLPSIRRCSPSFLGTH